MDQTVLSWNQLALWLRQVDTLRQASKNLAMAMALNSSPRVVVAAEPGKGSGHALYFST